MLHFIALLDERFVLFLNQFATKSAVFDGIMYDLADATILQGGLFMAYFWWAWLRTDGAVAKRRYEVIVSIGGGIAASVISRIMQVMLPFHTRPLHTDSLHFVVPLGVNPQTLNTWSSMPSDHAAMYFAFATAIWYQSRPLGYTAMAWTVAFGLIPRIYLGYHYPSDIVAGIACGIIIMVLTWNLTPRSRAVGRVLVWEKSHRALFYPAAFLLTYEVAILFFDVRHLAKDGFDLVRLAFDIHPMTQAASAF
jgi:undecaprenyl-diphosphatase